MASRIEEFGTPAAYNHFAVGWAHAMDAPYQWTKQVASHWGGTRNGTIVHWPSRISARGETRHQFHHVIDVAPPYSRWPDSRADLRTRGPAAAAGRCEYDLQLRGRRRPGPARDPVLRDVRQPRDLPPRLDRGHTPLHPWCLARLPSFEDDVWELYAPEDWTQANEPGRRAPRRAASAATAVHPRGQQVQRVPARRPAHRTVQPDLAGRRSSGATPSPVWRDGSADRVQGGQHQEQIPCGHRGVKVPRAAPMV